jgi:hypothetical protein
VARQADCIGETSMKRCGRLLAAALAASAAGCSPAIRHSVVLTSASPHPPPYRGAVDVRVTREPADGLPLALIQVYSWRKSSIEDLVPEMRRVAAGVGADFVKIDRVRTHFEEREESSTSSYECGTEKEPKTCTETRTDTVHEATTQILGRAFRTGR